uniref:Uncharacterized protein n=1 Tax=Arundo donax TaxID=35708 RepID=A0A0A8Y8U1_ARUDO
MIHKKTFVFITIIMLPYSFAMGPVFLMQNLGVLLDV